MTVTDAPIAAVCVSDRGVPSNPHVLRVEKSLHATVKEAYSSLGIVYGVLHTPPSSPSAPWLREAFAELKTVVAQYGTECSVSHVTVNNARELLRVLPVNAPKPELAIDPDGQIALEWQLAARWVLIATVAENSTVYFAGLFGVNKYRGAEHFEGTLPNGLAASLERFASPRSPDAVLNN